MILPANLFQKQSEPKYRSSRTERGQSLVEVAISLPVIILLLIGTLDFGLAILSYMVLRDSAQEGALYGSFNPANKDAIESRARSINPPDPQIRAYMPVDLNDENAVSVDVQIVGDDCRGISNEGPNSVQVEVSFEYPMFMPFAEQVAGSGTIRLFARATNVILQPPCQ